MFLQQNPMHAFKASKLLATLLGSLTIFSFPITAGVNLIGISHAATETYTTHTVQQGETLSSIARKYQTTKDFLIRLNNLTKPDALSIGQKLKVPAKSNQQSAAQEKTTPANKASSHSTSSHSTPPHSTPDNTTPSNSTKDKPAPSNPVPIRDLTNSGLKSAEQARSGTSQGKSAQQPKQGTSKSSTVTSASTVTSSLSQSVAQSIYVVKSGDVLGKIAERFHVSLDRLKSFNNKKDDQIRAGEKLRIPPEANLAAGRGEPSSQVSSLQASAPSASKTSATKQAQPVEIELTPTPVEEFKVGANIDLPPAEVEVVPEQTTRVSTNLPPAVREQIRIVDELAKSSEPVTLTTTSPTKLQTPAQAQAKPQKPAQATTDVEQTQIKQAQKPSKPGEQTGDKSQASEKVVETSTNKQPQPAGAHSDSFNWDGRSEYVCAPEALAVGIKHFRFPEVKESYLVHSGYGDKSNPKFKIHKDAKAALTKLVQAAKKDKVRLEPGSIFRGVKRQAQIVRGKQVAGQTPEEIYFTSSHPGYSEHHTGLAVDFLPIEHGFAKTPAYKWLEKHAAEFGFKRTFTEEYSKASGVSWESWHWRYEGVDGEFKYLFAESDAEVCQVPDQELKKLQAEFANKREAKKAPQAKKPATKSANDKVAKNAQPPTTAEATPKSQPANTAPKSNLAAAKAAETNKAVEATAAKDAAKPAQKQPAAEKPKK